MQHLNAAQVFVELYVFIRCVVSDESRAVGNNGTVHTGPTTFMSRCLSCIQRRVARRPLVLPPEKPPQAACAYLRQGLFIAMRLRTASPRHSSIRCNNSVSGARGTGRPIRITTVSVNPSPVVLMLRSDGSIVANRELMSWFHAWQMLHVLPECCRLLAGSAHLSCGMPQHVQAIIDQQAPLARVTRLQPLGSPIIQ